MPGKGKYLPPQSVWLLGLFGLEKGIIYTLVWFSRQPRERMNVVIVLIPNE